MDIELKMSGASDEKILARLFCDSLDRTDSHRWSEYFLYSSFVRKKILRFVSKKILESWDKLGVWLVLADRRVVGFVMVCWMEADESAGRTATIQELYLQPEFRGRSIEKQVVNFVTDFSIDNELRLGFAVKPEWDLDLGEKL